MANNISLREARLIIRKAKRRASGGEEISALNITSMMDMMTIIIVFLLKSFAVSTQGLAPPSQQNFHLPASTSHNEKIEMEIPVTVTQDAIVVAGYSLVPVKHGITGSGGASDMNPAFLVDPSFKEGGNKDSYIIEPLLTELKKHVIGLKKLAAYDPKEPFKGVLMLICDEKIPFRLVTEVLATSAEAGFSKYQLLTLKRDEGTAH